jgi:hypothetical protein
MRNQVSLPPPGEKQFGLFAVIGCDNECKVSMKLEKNILRRKGAPAHKRNGKK